jgi:hypothetical protein
LPFCANSTTTACISSGSRSRRRVPNGTASETASAAPRQPDSRFLEPYSNETDCEASAPCGDGLRRVGCDAAAGLLRRQHEQTSNFHPTRIIAFGDETSSIVDIDGNFNGHKFSVNGTALGTDTTIDCAHHPIWIQSLATAFGTFVFPTCNPAGSAVFDPPNRIRATVGARAADLSSQIDAQLAESDFRDGDMVTVLVGMHDVLTQYAQYPTISEPDLTANVEAAGREVARQVNRLAAGEAKIIVATIPDVSYSPYALAQKASYIDTDRQLLIQRLVVAFQHRAEAGAAQRRQADRPGAARRGGAPGGEVPGPARQSPTRPSRPAISASRSSVRRRRSTAPSSR